MSDRLEFETRHTRNQTLRRADWRFLLPNPYPRRVICRADDTLTRAVHAISHRVVQNAHAGECDLAVAMEPDDSVLNDLSHALCDTGSLYTGWYSPRHGNMQNIRRKLQARGFQNIEFYWATANDSPPAFWLPPESSQAMQYFFHSRPRKIFHRTQELVWNAAQRSGWMRPLHVIARKGTARPHASEINIDELITTALRGMGKSAPPKFSRLLLTRGKCSINKAVLLAFDKSSAHPRIAVKMPRVPEANSSLCQEKNVLDTLAALPLRSIPRVVQAVQHNGNLILAESVVEGAPLFTKLDFRTYRAFADRATDWLIQLAQPPRSSQSAEWRTRIVETALDTFRKHYGAVTDTPSIQDTRALLASLEIPGLVPEHRDFSPWNVLVQANGELGVLDWESAELCGLPAPDLIYFQTYLAFLLGGAMKTKRFVESYRALLDRMTCTGSIFAECMSRYAHAVGLDPQHLRALRVLTWLIHSRSEYRRLDADYPGGIPRHALENALFLKLWSIEMQP